MGHRHDWSHGVGSSSFSFLATRPYLKRTANAIFSCIKHIWLSSRPAGENWYVHYTWEIRIPRLPNICQWGSGDSFHFHDSLSHSNECCYHSPLPNFWTPEELPGWMTWAHAQDQVSTQGHSMSPRSNRLDCTDGEGGRASMRHWTWHMDLAIAGWIRPACIVGLSVPGWVCVLFLD